MQLYYPTHCNITYSKPFTYFRKTGGRLKRTEIVSNISVCSLTPLILLLQAKGLPYKEIDVSADIDVMQEMIQRSGNRSVPQIFIDGEAVGGFQELSQLHAEGGL